MGHPLRVRRGQRDRVGAAELQVARIDAQPDVRAGEYPVDFLAPLDHGSDVWMQRSGDPASTRTGVDPVEVCQQRRPTRLVQHRLHVVALDSAVGREHHDRGAGCHTCLDEPVDVRERVVVRVVEQDRQEAADCCHAELTQLLGSRSGLDGQEPDGAELRRGESQRAHLGEHPLRLELVPPARHLAHSPRDRGRGDARPGRTGPPSSGRAWRRRGLACPLAPQSSCAPSVRVARSQTSLATAGQHLGGTLSAACPQCQPATPTGRTCTPLTSCASTAAPPGTCRAPG